MEIEQGTMPSPNLINESEELIMARAKKVYTQEEVNKMTEKRMQKLFEEGRIDDDAVQRWYDNQEEIKQIISDAEEEFKTNIEGTDNPIEEDESEEVKMERANKCTVQATDKGYVVHFYRTHKHIGDIEVETVDGNHSAEGRENARRFAIDQCPQYNIEWNPEIQAQAWDRKHNTYMTDEEVSEDALTLVTPAIERLVEKCKYDMELQGIEVTAVTPNPSNLSYVENGRYTKSGAWCCASIEVTVKAHVIGEDMEILFPMELKSGQICKPKTTIAEWDMKVLEEMMLNGIDIPVDEKKSA